jgi:hypothetical protein
VASRVVDVVEEEQMSEEKSRRCRGREREGEYVTPLILDAQNPRTNSYSR